MGRLLGELNERDRGGGVMAETRPRQAPATQTAAEPGAATVGMPRGTHGRVPPGRHLLRATVAARLSLYGGAGEDWPKNLKRAHGGVREDWRNLNKAALAFPHLVLGPVPHVEAAHLRAAATHDRAALLHDQAAELFDMMGLPSLARGERARARLDREGAAAELERAKLRRDLASRP